MKTQNNLIFKGKSLKIALTIILVLLFIMPVVNAQDRVIYGKVNILDSIPLMFIKIMAMSTKDVVLSDSVGLFAIKCKENDKLKIYGRGFYTQKVKVTKNTKFILANLKPKPGMKSREYSTGYGNVTDTTKTSAISSINRDESDFSNYSTMTELIYGQLSNVQIIGEEIVIRGLRSINGNGALIILDGRPISFNILQTIYPGDVERISVIKDGSAAMYGVQGANGVLIVDTRRGGE